MTLFERVLTWCLYCVTLGTRFTYSVWYQPKQHARRSLYSGIGSAMVALLLCGISGLSERMYLIAYNLHQGSASIVLGQDLSYFMLCLRALVF